MFSFTAARQGRTTPSSVTGRPGGEGAVSAGCPLAGHSGHCPAHRAGCGPPWADLRRVGAGGSGG